MENPLKWLWGKDVKVRVTLYERSGAVDAVYRGRVEQILDSTITLVDVCDCTGGGCNERGTMVLPLSHIRIEVIKEKEPDA